MGEKKRIALIGAGGIARGVHMPSLQDLPEVQVCGVCDLDRERAKNGASYFEGAAWYDNYRLMLEEEKPEGVFVLVQPDQSYRIALDCMRAGADVFCEKPAGITLYQLESLERTQRECGVLLQIGFNRRYIPLVQRVLEEMRALGPIVQVNGHFFKNGDASFYDGCASALECDVIHVADLLCYFADSDAREVKAVAGRVNSPVDNSWNAVFAFENGIQGTIRSNYQTGGRTHAFELHGPNASAYINLGFGTAACEAEMIYFGGKKSFSLASTGTQEEHIVHFDGYEENGEYYRYYGYFNEDEAFVRSMDSREPPVSDIHAAIRAMKLIDAIRKSST